MNDSIFIPRFDISTSMRSTLEDIERQRWLIDNMLLMPKHEAWIRRDVQVRRASGTTRIEGASLDETAVSKLVDKRPAGRPTADEQANVNALEAYEFVDFLTDQLDVPVDELVIRQLNRYILTGGAEVLTPGNYRKGENTVGSFTPPNQGDVASLMRSFALWLRDASDETHPILRAGLAHIHLVAIHPFWDGNGRVARALSTLLLQRSPFGFKRLLSLESYLFDIRDDYIDAIERTLGTTFEPDYDATPWLDFLTSAFRVHVDWLVAHLTDWHRMMQDLHDDGAELGLLPRQVDGHIFALRTGQITRRDYMQVTGVSGVTASRDLGKLVAFGLLTADGNARSRIYRPRVPETDPDSADRQLSLIH